MRIVFSVATVQRVTVADALQFLTGVATVRNGLALADNHWVMPTGIGFEGQKVIRDAGRAMVPLGSLEGHVPGIAYQLAVQRGISSSHLIELREGSLEGTLEELAERIRRRLANILRASGTLVDKLGDEQEFIRAVISQFGTSPPNETTAGIIAIGAIEMRDAYRSMRATGIDVRVVEVEAA